MPAPRTDGSILRRWREARGWTTRQMARALQEASEEPLPPVSSLLRMIGAWERGAAAQAWPSEEYLFLYHRVFPGFGDVEPPAGIAVFGGPGQPGAREILAEARQAPGPAEVAALADAALAAGADPARIWALRETISDLRAQADGLTAVLAAMTGDGAAGDARTG